MKAGAIPPDSYPSKVKTHMIDFNRDINNIVFRDFAEPVTLTKADGTPFTFNGIFGYQSENPQIQNVIISDAAKLTLTIASQTLAELNVTIEDNTDTLTIRGKDYVALTVRDSLNGMMTVMLGDK